jgi:hypothetical protein
MRVIVTGDVIVPSLSFVDPQVCAVVEGEKSMKRIQILVDGDIIVPSLPYIVDQDDRPQGPGVEGQGQDQDQSNGRIDKDTSSNIVHRETWKSRLRVRSSSKKIDNWSFNSNFGLDVDAIVDIDGSSDTSNVQKSRTKPCLWNKRLLELAAYKEEVGDTNIPYYYAQNKPLRRWAADQRYFHKLFKKNRRSTLTMERIRSLEKLGFVWRYVEQEIMSIAPVLHVSVETTVGDDGYESDDSEMYLII